MAVVGCQDGLTSPVEDLAPAASLKAESTDVLKFVDNGKPGRGKGANPETVDDLAVSSVERNSVALTFTEVSGAKGEPAYYAVKYSKQPFHWNSATSVSQGSCAGLLSGTETGVVRTCSVLGLDSDAEYGFQLTATTIRVGEDNSGSRVTLSNVASARTLPEDPPAEDPPPHPPAEDPPAADPPAEDPPAADVWLGYSLTGYQRLATGKLLPLEGASVDADSVWIRLVDRNEEVVPQLSFFVNNKFANVENSWTWDMRSRIAFEPGSYTVRAEWAGASLSATFSVENGSSPPPPPAADPPASEPEPEPELGRAPASTAWPNLPAGYSTIIDDTDWSESVPSGWSDPFPSSSWPKIQNGGLEFFFPKGHKRGSAEGARVGPGGWSATNVFLGLTFKLSSGYVAHTSGEKWWWLRHPGDQNGFFGQIGPGGAGVVAISYLPQGGGAPVLSSNIDSSPPSLGVWHTFETLFEHQSGTLWNVKWWLDGKLVASHTNVDLATTTMTNLFLRPWRGGAPEVPLLIDEFFSFGHTFLATP